MFFSSLIDHFAESHRVITLDLLGHGKSSKISYINEISHEEKEILSRAFYNPFANITIIKQVLENLNVHNVHVIGWSLGGHLAYALASLYPQLIKSIITIASPPVTLLYTHSSFRDGFAHFFPDIIIPNWIEKPQSFTIEDAIASALYSGFDIREEKNQIILYDIEKSDPLMRKYFFALSGWNDKEMTLLDGEKIVINTVIPIMLMVSDLDATVNASYISKFSKRLKNENSKVIIIKSNKHASFLHHEFFTNEVHNFYLNK